MFRASLIFINALFHQQFSVRLFLLFLCISMFSCQPVYLSVLFSIMVIVESKVYRDIRLCWRMRACVRVCCAYVCMCTYMYVTFLRVTRHSNSKRSCGWTSYWSSVYTQQGTTKPHILPSGSLPYTTRTLRAYLLVCSSARLFCQCVYFIFDIYVIPLLCNLCQPYRPISDNTLWLYSMLIQKM